MRFDRRFIGVAGVVVALAWPASSTGFAADTDSPSPPSLGANVYVFDPSMPQSQIQATVDGVAAQQVNNEFGPQRYALLFKPGTYGTSTNPLNFQVGYYTAVAGLGLSPNDVVINGSVYVRNRCLGPNNCIALVNFWRSLSNLTINVTTPNFGCYFGEFWPVSQAAPMRRVHVNGYASLMDYCTGPSYASGGFIADSEFDGSSITSGSQQQWITRNSKLDGWSNGVWNMVFSGVIGAPAGCFTCGNQYTTVATNRVTREAPFLYTDSTGGYSVFVPAAQYNSSGTTWAAGQTLGTSIPISSFFIAEPSDSAATINTALHRGRNLILTPGIYQLDQPIQVTRPDSVVLGLGFPTLIPTGGNPSMVVARAKGMLVSGVLFDAGPTNSSVLLQVGDGHARSDNEASDPSVLSDVFFRIGGATAGQATTSLVVNSNNVILDDIWAWRADHGNGVGWTSNTADTGVVVNGNNVTAYGLFVEHFQKYEVIWNGDNGQDIFFQNELPYDPPSQAEWMATPTQVGYPAFYVTPNVKTFSGYGMGSYVVFINTTATLFDAEAYQAPVAPGVQFHDILTVWIAGSGGFNSIINGVGGPDTSTNPGKVRPVDVVSYP
jgi:hypothetical protein